MKQEIGAPKEDLIRKLKDIAAEYFTIIAHLRVGIKISIVFGLLLMGSMAVYFIKIYPEFAKTQQEEVPYKACLGEAFTLYREKWDQACKKDNQGSGCGLSERESESINDYLDDLKRNCYVKHR